MAAPRLLPEAADKSASWVLHLDVDAFYVAAEAARNASLLKKPVAVTQANGGGFCAVNALAKARGVRKGDGIGKGGLLALHRPADSSMAATLQRCPDLVVLPMDTDWYRRVSLKLLRTLEACCPAKSGFVVEKSSIDDFFIAIPPSALSSALSLASSPSGPASSAAAEPAVALAKYQRGSADRDREYLDPELLKATTNDVARSVPPYIPSLVALMLRLREAIAAAFGGDVTCGIAAGRNKLLARLASKFAKPDGLAVLLPEHEDALVRACPLRKVYGLKGQTGDAVETELRAWMAKNSISHAEEANSGSNGILTLGDLRAVPFPTLQAWCSSSSGSILRPKDAQWLHLLAQGIDHSPVTPFKPPATVISERSFLPLESWQQARGWLRSLTEVLVDRLKEDHDEFDKRLPEKLVLQYRVGYYSLSSSVAASSSSSSAIATATSEFSAKAVSTAMPSSVIKFLRAASAPLLTSSSSAASSDVSAGPRAKAIADVVEAVMKLLTGAFNASEASASSTCPRLTKLVVGASNFAEAGKGMASLDSFFATDAPPSASSIATRDNKQKAPSASADADEADDEGVVVVLSDDDDSRALSSTCDEARQGHDRQGEGEEDNEAGDGDDADGWVDEGPDLGVGFSAAAIETSQPLALPQPHTEALSGYKRKERPPDDEHSV